MAEEKILLSLELDVDKVNAGLVEAKANIAATKNSIKDLNKELAAAFTANDKEKVKDINQQIVLLETDLRKLTTTERELRKQVDLNTKANESQAGSYEQLAAQAILAKNELNKLEGTLKKGADGTIVLTEAYQKAKLQVDNANQALIAFDQNVGSGGRNVGNYAAALKPLQDQVQELQKGQAALNQTLQGFTALQNVTKLATGENSEATKLLSDAATGLSIIQNLGNIRLGISSSLLAANTIQQSISKTAIAASATATGLFTGSTNLATIATAAWNAVLNLNPIVAITTAITLSVAAIYQFVKGTNAASDATDNLQKKLSDQKKTVEDVGNTWKKAMADNDHALEVSHKNFLNDQETRIAAAKARGASLSEVYSLERKLIDDNLTLLKSSGNADEAEYHALINRKKLLTQQYYIDIENQRAANLGKQFDDYQEQLLIVQEALNAVDPNAQLEEIVNAAMKTAETEFKMNAEIVADKKRTTDEALSIHSKYIDAVNDLDVARTEFVQSGTEQVMSFFRQNTLAYKALFLTQKAAAISQVIIRLQEQKAAIAAVNALLGPAGIPITAAQIAAANVRAAISIGTIAAQALQVFNPPKAAKGGIFGGKPHNAGGTKGYFDDGTIIEVEKDELFAVVNKRDTEILGRLSAINSIHGKPFFGRSSDYLADGGFAARTATNNIINSFSMDGLIRAISAQKIFVRVTDINSAQGQHALVTDRATF